MRTYVTLAWLFAVTAAGLAQQPCAADDLTREALLPLSLQIKLLQHSISKDDFELGAPADVGRDVVMLRKTLDLATQAFFRCEASDEDAASLQTLLATFLHASRSARGDSQNRTDGIYGANLRVHVEQANGLAHSIFVNVTFDIECGNDNLLFLYTRDSGSWRQRLAWYSDKYTRPSDAFGDFLLYAAVPGAENVQLVAVAHGTPWCTSRFSHFTVDLIAPADGTKTQRLLAETAEDYSRGDTVPALEAEGDGFALRLDASSRDLDGVFTYLGVYHYATTSNQLERLPVAINARAFVDSWLDESWKIASQWSLDPDDHLRAEHRRFSFRKDEIGSNSEASEVPIIHYGPVRGCTDASAHFQIEMQLSAFTQVDGKPRQKRLQPVYAHVRQNPGSFTMLAITDKPARACTGPDLMRKH